MSNSTEFVGNSTTQEYVLGANTVNVLQPIISDATLASGLFVVDCILTPVFAVGGLIGNLLSFIVLLQHNTRTGVNVCLAALAFSDSLFLIISFIRRATCIIKQFNPLAAQWYDVQLFPPTFYLSLVFGRITTLITVLITVNRFVAVVFPLSIRAFQSRRKLLTAIGLITIVSFMTILPIALLYETGERYDTVQNKTIPYLAPTEFFLNDINAIQQYSQIVLVVVFRHIPAILLVVLNLSIWIHLQRQKRIRSQLTAMENRKTKIDEDSVTKMLLVISGLFLACLLPGSISLLINQFVDGYGLTGAYRNLFAFVSAITFLLELINSSVNFIVYMALSQSFSRTYKRLFCCNWKQTTQNSGSRSAGTSTYSSGNYI